MDITKLDIHQLKELAWDLQTNFEIVRRRIAELSMPVSKGVQTPNSDGIMPQPKNSDEIK